MSTIILKQCSKKRELTLLSSTSKLQMVVQNPFWKERKHMFSCFYMKCFQGGQIHVGQYMLVLKVIVGDVVDGG